jgi:hypothetical protein
MATTNWIVLTADDLSKVIDVSVIRKADANIDATSLEDGLTTPINEIPPVTPPLDLTLDRRASEQITFCVNQMRAAIQLANKDPLSLTAGSVPPEAAKHVLYLAAFGLVNSSPSLQMVLMNDQGVYAPLQTNFKAANDYLAAVSKGKPVTPPTDPTGRDYINPVNVPWYGTSVSPYGTYNSAMPINPLVSSVRGGFNSRRVDMNTFDGLFLEPAPPWWPAGEIGQP